MGQGVKGQVTSSGPKEVAPKAMHPWIVALRPWSFPAAIVPVILTGAITYRSGVDASLSEFFRALALGVITQAMSNVNNTYWDFVGGLDMKSEERGEDLSVQLKHKSMLADGKTKPSSMLALTGILLAMSVGVMWTKLMESALTLQVYGMGTFLAIFYTAPPFNLKYYALGDIAIFIAFGPLLTYCTLLLIAPGHTDQLWFEVFGYTIPCAFICECILHANNGRDIGEDSKAGLLTLANLLGFANSKVLYVGLIGCAYLGVMTLALFKARIAVFLVLLSLPAAIDCIGHFSRDKNLIADLPKRTAKLHMIFGTCLTLGVLAGF